MTFNEMRPQTDRDMMAAAVGRVVMGLCFIVFGATKLLAIAGTIAFIRGAGMPLPEAVFWLAVVIEVGLGIALVVGYRVREIAAFLAFYCVFIAFVFHFDLGNRGQRDQFLKNLVMAAGFLYVTAAGAGAWSIQAPRPRP